MATLQEKIAALIAETREGSVTPERMGKLLQDVYDMVEAMAVEVGKRPTAEEIGVAVNAVVQNLTELINGLGEEIDNKVSKVEEQGHTYAVAEGMQTTDGINYHLPESAPIDDKSHTLATKYDIETAIAEAITNTLNTAV